MEGLNEMQQFRAGLAKEMDWDIRKAQEVYGFVIGKEEAEKTAIKIPQSTFNEGIFYVLSDKSVVPVCNLESIDKETIVGVAVKAMGRVASVGLHDAAEGEEIALIENDCAETSEFYRKSFKDAIADWDGKGNTERLKPYLNSEIELKDDEYIPSVGQLHLILLFLNEVNNALIAAGGEAMKDDWYWSSTEGSPYNAWYVYFNGGGTGNGRKYSNYVVRPSVACEL